MKYKIKNRYFWGLALLATSSASAVITIDTVLVGDAGNANDSTGLGSVSYTYHIGTYEVTNGQYTAFLNATATTDTHGLYSPYGGIHRSGTSGSFSYSVKSGFANKPVNYVSFWDAARFSNWLTSGNTETGVYNLNGTTNPTNSTITRDATAWTNGGVAVVSQNEWYKAAYYSGSPTGADGDGYWLYPTQSNSITLADANYGGGRGAEGTVTDVGAYVSAPSHYGTFDQGGNVWEWNDTRGGTSDRVLRGGSFDLDRIYLQPSRINGDIPTFESINFGFRVSSLAPIPEPSSALLVGISAFLVAARRRRIKG